jgi:hypothetical protein
MQELRRDKSLPQFMQAGLKPMRRQHEELSRRKIRFQPAETASKNTV